jgi:hypothetical protein
MKNRFQSLLFIIQLVPPQQGVHGGRHRAAHHPGGEYPRAKVGAAHRGAEGGARVADPGVLLGGGILFTV